MRGLQETLDSMFSACIWACLMAQMVKNLPAMCKTWVHYLGEGDPQVEFLTCKFCVIFL